MWIEINDVCFCLFYNIQEFRKRHCVDSNSSGNKDIEHIFDSDYYGTKKKDWPDIKIESTQKLACLNSIIYGTCFKTQITIDSTLNVCWKMLDVTAN